MKFWRNGSEILGLLPDELRILDIWNLTKSWIWKNICIPHELHHYDDFQKQLLYSPSDVVNGQCMYSFIFMILSNFIYIHKTRLVRDKSWNFETFIPQSRLYNILAESLTPRIFQTSNCWELKQNRFSKKLFIIIMFYKFELWEIGTRTARVRD